MKYRKKPVVIEAMHFDGSADSATEIEMWADGDVFMASIATGEHNRHTLVIETLEGQMQAVKGDWIIKGIKGEFYPCKPDIFDATYEPVES
jgi:urease accessory protein UreH